MLARNRLPQLLLGTLLGLAFIGCVGLPRRKAPTDHVPTVSKRPSPKPASAEVADPPALRIRAQFASTRKVADVPVGEMPADSLAALRRLHDEAARQHAGVDSYIVRLSRRESLRGKMQPEEVMLFKFRKQPKSVYLKWIGKEGAGREAVWVEGRHEGKLHTLTAAGDVPLMPAGKRISLSPDSILVRSNSRHSITEAGIGTLIDRFGQLLAALEKGDISQGKLAYLGKQKRPEFADELEAVEWTLPPGVDASLPKGGKRFCWIDGTTRLPALIVTHDERGQEVEHYRYDRWLLNPNLDDDDFNPDRLWGKQP